MTTATERSERLWPFADPPHTAVLTDRSVREGRRPALRIAREAGGGGWRLLDGEVVDEADAVVLSLEEAVSLLPVLRELADLPPGWCAWRDRAIEPWRRAPCEGPIPPRGLVRVRADVRAFGWHAVLVPAHAKSPAFAYTTGLFASFRHPELLVAGLDVDVMNTLLAVMVEGVRDGGRFEAGKAYGGIVSGYACAFRWVHPRHFAERLGVSRAFYGERGFPALQCVWPDRSGRFPWTSGCDPNVMALQPLFDA